MGSEKKINRIILTLYLLLIAFSYVFVFITDNTIYLILSATILALVSWFISGYLLRIVSRIPHIDLSKNNVTDKKTIIIVFAVSALFSFVVLMIWFIGYRPGSFQGDCVFQYKQAITGRYTDWHPAWQTFLFYTIPLKLTGGALWSMTFFQMLWFSLIMGYVCVVVFRYAGIKWMIGILAYIMLNPYTGQMLLYPWKDSAFAMAGAVVMAMSVCIFCSKGEWADSLWRCVLFGIFAANCTVFRHNAILFTAVVLIATGFFTAKKRWLIIAMSAVLSYVVIQGPVSALLHVESDPQTVVQAVGLPMTVIGNVTKETPDKLDEETSEFVYSMADQEAWESDDTF